MLTERRSGSRPPPRDPGYFQSSLRDETTF